MWAETQHDGEGESVMALSFQDEVGCSQMWDTINDIQKTLKLESEGVTVLPMS